MPAGTCLGAIPILGLWCDRGSSNVGRGRSGIGDYRLPKNRGAGHLKQGKGHAMSKIRMLHLPARQLGSARVVALALALGASSLAGMTIAPQAVADSTGATQTFVVLYKSGASTSGASSAVSSAGGTVVANYKQIGVVIARSNNTAFATSLQNKSGVEAVSATTGLGVQLESKLRKA